MSNYEHNALIELAAWQQKMAKRPSSASMLAKRMQNKVNGLIPEKAHKVITETIKTMVKAVLTGSGFISPYPLVLATLEHRERLVGEKIHFYRRAAATSGAWTGAGGILLGLADFPILLSMKLKMLFDIAALYGFNTGDYRERLYILYIFQLAFSSPEKRRSVYFEILDWEAKVKQLPQDMNDFDWRAFQQEYRDYIDVAKMLQLVPVIGAAVGAYANYQLIDRLGETATYAYRMRMPELKQI